MKDRIEPGKLVDEMVKERKSGLDIADAIIGELTPEDGEECPVCGILP